MLLRRIYPTFAAILPVQKRQLTIINTLKHFFIMQRDKSLMERRNKAIYARFNELIRTGKQYIKIYEQLEDEFFISEETIKKIVLRMTKKQ